MASTAATHDPPAPTRGRGVPGGEVRGSERMNNLFNTRPVEWDLLVIGVAKMSKGELVMATLIRLEGDFATGSSNGFEQLARSFLILPQLVIHLEGSSATKNKGSRDSSVARTPGRVSMVYVIPRNHSPLVNLLPFNLCAREGHLDDLASFRAENITVAILALYTKDSIFARHTRT